MMPAGNCAKTLEIVINNDTPCVPDLGMLPRFPFSKESPSLLVCFSLRIWTVNSTVRKIQEIQEFVNHKYMCLNDAKQY